MRIYFVLLRFGLISVLSAVLDNLLFWLALHFLGSTVAAQLAARSLSALFNYSAVRKAAFHSEEPHEVVLPQYLLLVAVNVIISYAGIRALTAVFPVGLFAAKLLAETLLFLANFAIQRDFIFTRNRRKLPRVATAEWRQIA